MPESSPVPGAVQGMQLKMLHCGAHAWADQFTEQHTRVGGPVSRVPCEAQPSSMGSTSTLQTSATMPRGRCFYDTTTGPRDMFWEDPLSKELVL